jgi:hypothetical protein
MTLAVAIQEHPPPRGVTDQVIASLPTATFQEWATEDSDQMCPICFEDVCRFTNSITNVITSLMTYPVYRP